MPINSETAIADTDRRSAGAGAATPASSPIRPDLGLALAECRNVRRSIQSILHYAKRGAHDLYGGLTWSNSLEQFEALSMEQARNLARFPVGSEDPRFGSAVRQAKAAFIVFRETVRREAIAIIEPDIQEAMLAEILGVIDNKADAAIEKLEALERALSSGYPT